MRRPGGLSLVRELPQQLWVVLLIILFNSYKYFTMATVLSLFATNEYGLTDVEAGKLYGMWGLMHTLWGFAGSFMVDCFGIRAVAVIATTFGVISRGLLVFSHSVGTLRLVLIGLGPLAEGICDPLYLVAIKKLTRRRIRAFAFAMQYAFMNLGGAIGENLTDLLRGRTWRMPWGEEWSGLRFVLFTTWLAADVCWLLAWFIHDPKPKPKVAQVWSPGLEANAFNQQASAGFVGIFHPSPPSSPGSSPSSSPRRSPAPSPCDDAVDMSLLVEELPPVAARPPSFPSPRSPPAMPSGWAEKSWRQRAASSLRHVQEEVSAYNAGGAFARAVLLTTAVLFVSLQWRYMDTLLPKFAERTFGTSCPWGAIYSINSWMCVLCPPLISAWTPGDRVDDFALIVPGLWIMALSPLCIYASVSEGATAAWVFVMSCGEVLWSPRSQSFIASLAPAGREGAFLALAGSPAFLTQYPVGIISGWLLDTYCPTCPSVDNASCERDPAWRANPAGMWFWVALTSAVSPMMVTGLAGYFKRGISASGALED